MVTPGDRFKGWIDSFAVSIKDRLAGWMAGWLDKGIDTYFRAREPEIIKSTRASLTKLKSVAGITPELSSLIDESLTTGDISTVIFGWLFTLLGVIPAILGQGAPIGRKMEYTQERLYKSFRLDPNMVVSLWRRDKTTYERYLDDLKDMGWSDERIEALKFVTQFLPSPRDLVEWQAKEVFEPKMVEKYGLEDEFAELDLSLFAKVGVTEEQARNFWIAHWEHASWTQVIEMLHRGQITEVDVWDWFRLIEIPPYWRQKLINVAWVMPTRVDVRRFWDMRTIDETRLREIYTGLGYHGKDLDDYVLWTKIYTDFPDLLARYKNGWITLEDVKSELIATGMKPERAETLIQEKVKKAAPERVAAEKSLTKAEIVKGVKKEIITVAEGIELLQDMGYGPDEANYIMAVNLEVATGSPKDFAEFKDLTQGWRIAAGMGGKPMSEEIKRLGADVVRLTGEVAAIQKSIQDELGSKTDIEGLPETATAHLRELQAALYKAQGELARVQTDYNAKVAEWRHVTK